jgi:putative ABC transport system permease protein
VLSAIGAPPRTVRRLVVLEGIFIAVVSCIIAAIPALALTAAVVEYLPMPGLFQISAVAVVIWIVAVVVGAALSTLTPAYRASRLTVREGLAYI